MARHQGWLGKFFGIRGSAKSATRKHGSSVCSSFFAEQLERRTVLDAGVLGGIGGAALLDTSLPVATATATSAIEVSSVGAIGTPGLAWGITASVDGRRVYVANRDSGLQIYDVSAPGSIRRLGGVDTPGSSYNVLLSSDEHYAYVTDFTGGLQIVDVSVASAPSIVATVNMGGKPHGLELSADGTTLFVAAWEAGVKVINVSTPSLPQVIATLPTTGYASGVALSGDGRTAFIATYSGVVVYDISSIQAARQLLTVVTPGQARDIVLSMDGRYAFVGDHTSNTMQVLDVTKPASSLIVASVATGSTTRGISLSRDGRLAYVSSGGVGLKVIDVSSPTSPTIVASFSTSSQIITNVICGDGPYIALASDVGGLQVVESLSVLSVAAGQAIYGSTSTYAQSRVVKRGPGSSVLDSSDLAVGGVRVDQGELVLRQPPEAGCGPLEVMGTARLVLDTGGQVVTASSLGMSQTARVDLGDAGLRFSVGAATEASVRDLLSTGRNGGGWDGGSGIVSSWAASRGLAIGYRRDGDQLTVQNAACGDTNLDGVVDVLDAANIAGASAFNSGLPTTWSDGDFNYDGWVDILDIADFLGTGLFNQGEYRNGYTDLFDGATLNGWTGDSRYWAASGGAIVGQSTSTLAANTFLTWNGGVFSDFDMKVEYRITSGNSGIQFRSSSRGGYSVGGYQADIDAAVSVTGNLYEELGRGQLAKRGEVVSIAANGTKSVTGSVGTSAGLAAIVRTGDWNVYRIVAKGTEIRQYINGVLMCVANDGQTGSNAAMGLLALQLHAGNPMKVEFRSIRVKPV